MAQLHITDFDAYARYLDKHGDEHVALFNTILINVTCFCRDPQSGDGIRNEVVPRIVSAKAPGEPIRAWSAGCASGEEAYTIAMVLAQELGAAQYRERVKIYGGEMTVGAAPASGLTRSTGNRNGMVRSKARRSVRGFAVTSFPFSHSTSNT